MSGINELLLPGEYVIKKQGGAYDQGFNNQADGTLYLTNQRLVFDIKERGLNRGLELVFKGEKNAQIESIEVKLEDVSHVDKKRLAIEVHTFASTFREMSGKKRFFGSKGEGRVFDMEPAKYRFAFHILVNKEEWVDEIDSQKGRLVSTISPQTPLPPPPDYGDSQREGPPVHSFPQEATVLRERIVIKEIVKIKCSYCGNLYDQGSNRCPYCGAKA